MKSFISFVTFSLLLASINSLATADDDKVKIGFYYETCCPDCRDYLLGDLENVRRNIDEYIDIQLIPFGKAKVNTDNTVTCQHGEPECFGNAIQACALNILKFEKTYQLTKCMFRSTQFRETELLAKQCTLQLGMNYTLLETCADGTQGFGFIQKMEELSNVNGPLTYVPWVTVDDKRVETDLLEYICNNQLKDKNIPGCQ